MFRITCTGISVFAMSLACGGLNASQDEVIAALKNDDFATAESILEGRLATSPDDAYNNRLMGDLCLRRAQAFPRVANKNQKRAIDSYRRSVEANPTKCENWNRLALAIAGGMTEKDTRFEPASIAKLPLREGHESCEGAAMLFLESYQQPSEAEVVKLGAKLGAAASKEAIQLERFPSMLMSYNAIDWTSLGWQTVIKPPTAEAGRWFVVSELPQTAKGLAGARDRKIDQLESNQIAKVIGNKVGFVDYGHGATLTSKGYVPASFCPGEVSWRMAAGHGTPVGYCTKGPVKAGAQYYRAASMVPADESHWSQESMRKSLLNPAAAKEARCMGGIVNRMLGFDASCEITYRQGIISERSIEKSRVRIAQDQAHAERVLSAVRRSVMYGEKVAKELTIGRIAEGLPYELFLLVPSETSSCTGRSLMAGLNFSDDYESIVTRCSVDGFEFDIVDMSIAGWRRARE